MLYFVSLFCFLFCLFSLFLIVVVCAGPDEATYDYGHGILVFTSIIAGLTLMALGLARMGRYVAQVPHSIVVGFTIGTLFSGFIVMFRLCLIY